MGERAGGAHGTRARSPAGRARGMGTARGARPCGSDRAPPPGISWHVQLSVCGFAGLNQGASVRPQPASSGQGPGSQDRHPGEARGRGWAASLPSAGNLTPAPP